MKETRHDHTKSKSPGGQTMNWDRIEGKWKQYKGQVKEQWGKLTNDDLDTISGQRQQLVGRIQERYGIAKEDAEEEVDEFVKGLKADDKKEQKARRAASH
jgi:uncharacterized protein YjbJ (UPF0337 family)